MVKPGKLHPSFYGVCLFVLIIVLLTAGTNFDRYYPVIRAVAFLLFPVMFLLGVVGMIRSRRWFHYLTSIICILIAAPISYALKNVPVHGYTPIESIWSVLSHKNTVWADGYSKTRFAKVRTGMSEAEILQLLGEPLVIENRKSGVHWFYTSGPEGNVQGRVNGSTHIRNVVFKSGEVVSKESSFYID